MTGHCPSPYQIVDIQRCGGAELLSHRKGAQHWIYFSLMNCRSPTATGMSVVDRHCLRSGDIGQRTKCTKPLTWSAILSWSSFVLLLKRHTGSDTEHHGAREKRRNSSITVHISIDTGAPFFFTFPKRPHARSASDVPCRMSQSST